MLLNKKLFFLIIIILLQGPLILPFVSKSQDSVSTFNKKDSITSKNEKDEKYRETHKEDWSFFPLDDFEYYCNNCKFYHPLIFEEYKNAKMTFIDAFTRDTLVYTTVTAGIFNIPIFKTHFKSLKGCKIPQKFLYHMEIFKDSLPNINLSIPFIVDYLNNDNNIQYYSRIKKTAPFGYVDSWSWNKEYSNLSFSIEYTNTNSKTIKYLAVYFKATNDVGDIRKIGYFQGTGPVEEWETVTWNWDYSDYYVAGDTNHMTITKIVITYMNGSKKILTKNKIIYK